MGMLARGEAAFSAAIRFASASIIRCRSANLVEVQTNLRLPRHSTMRRAQQCRYFARSLPPSKRHSRLTIVRRGCWMCRIAGIHGEAMYTALTLRSACSHSSYKLPMSGSRGTPLAFLWGIQRGYSLRKENTPFGVAARTPLSLPRLRGKRCGPFGLSFPPRGARKAPAPLRAQKRAPLRVLFFKLLRISRTGTSGRLRR